MPRRKTVGEVSTSRPIKIQCPACQSEISTDGGTLHKKSDYLSDLESGAGEFEKTIEALSAKLNAANARNEELSRAATAPKKITEEVKPDVGKKEGTGNGQPKRKFYDW